MATSSFFIHVVYFWLRSDLSQEEKAQFAAGVHSLTTIDSVKQGFLGTPASTDRPIIDSSYDQSLILVFKDKAAHDAYQEHPIHDKFRDDCGTFWSKVQIYDSIG